MVKRILRLMLFALFCFALIFGSFGVWLAHNRALVLVYPGRSLPRHTPADVGLPVYEDITFTTADGLTLHGWFIPPDPTGDGATLVFAHGLGSNRGGLLSQAALLHREGGYGALLYDARNHGASDGTVTTLGYNEIHDVYAALDYLARRPEVAPDRIALIGESMGGAAVVRAAANRPDVRALVVQSSFSSLEDNIAEGVEQVTGLPAFPFAPLIIFFGEREAGIRISDVRPVDDIARLSPRPVLIMHGTADTLIHYSNGQRLYDAAGEPRTLYLIEDGWHGGLISADADGVAATLTTFLHSALRGE